MYEELKTNRQATPAQSLAVKLYSITDISAFRNKAQELLESGRRHEVISFLPWGEAVEFLKGIRQVYTDFDGTILDPGAVVLPERTQAAILTLHHQGVKVIGVTGKPWAEIADLVQGLPPAFPLEIIFEKGAFFLGRDQFGQPEKRFLLATPEAAQATAQVKGLFWSQWKKEIERALQQNGQDRIRLELAGTGTHECVFSLDVLDPALAPSGDAFKTWPGGRDAIKIHDQKIIAQVDDLMTARIQTIPGFERSQAVDLGNSNLEWAPNNTRCRIEKDLAVAAHAGFRVQEDALRGKVIISAPPSGPNLAVLGDSGNDRPLFSLAKDFTRMTAMLVYHQRTPADMLEHAGFAAAGLSNGAALLEAIAMAIDNKY